MADGSGFLNFGPELVVDLFAGGGGASLVVYRMTSKTDQVRLIGNSVCPDVSEALARANLADLIAFYERCAA